MIKPNIDVVVNDSCCCAPSTYRTVVLKCNMIGNDNILTQEMISTPLTKYVIKYDYIIDPYPINGVANIPVTNKIENCCGSDEIIYYSDNFVNIPAGKTITIPEDCFLISEPGGRRVNFTVAEQDTLVRIASYTPGVYRYKILKALVLPEKSLIQFDGGSISNGTLVGKDTIVISYLDNEDIFKDVDLKGTFVFTKFGNLTLTEEILEPQAGEKIVPVYKKITIGNGREDVSFNVHSFEVQDIDRVIRFDYGGSQPYEITLSKGQNSFRFPTAEELGFDRVLEGWYTKDNDWILDDNGNWWNSTQGEHRYNPGEEYIIPEGVEELKFYVHWLCSVTFVSLYGSVPTSQTLNLGELVSLSPITLSEPTESDPTNPYYTTKFEGWYLDLNYTNKVLDLQYLLTLNVTFYAKWNTNIVTVRFYFKYYTGRFNLIKEEVIDRDKNEQVQVPTVADSIDYTLEYVKYWVYKNNPDSIAIAEGQTTWLPSGEPKLIEVYAVRALNLQFNPDGGSVNLIRVTVNHNNLSKSITVGENINTEDIYVDDKLIFDAYSGTKLGYKLSENGDFYWPSTEIAFINNELTIDEDTIEDSDGVLVISPYWVTDSITLTWKDVDGTTLKQDNITSGNIVLQNYLPTLGDFPDNSSYLYIGSNGTYVIHKRIEKEIEWITGGKAELGNTGYVHYIASTAYWKINNNEVDLSLSITITGNTEIILGFKDPKFTTNHLSVVLDTFIAPSLIIDANSEYTFKGWMDEDNNTFDNFTSITGPSYFDNHSKIFIALWESNKVLVTVKAPKCTYLSLGDGFGRFEPVSTTGTRDGESKIYYANNNNLSATVKIPKTKTNGDSTSLHFPYAYREYRLVIHKSGVTDPIIVSRYSSGNAIGQNSSWRITNIDGDEIYENPEGNTLSELGITSSVVLELPTLFNNVDNYNPNTTSFIEDLNSKAGKASDFDGWYIANGTKLTLQNIINKIRNMFSTDSSYNDLLIEDVDREDYHYYYLKFHVYDYDPTTLTLKSFNSPLDSDLLTQNYLNNNGISTILLGNGEGTTVNTRYMHHYIYTEKPIIVKRPEESSGGGITEVPIGLYNSTNKIYYINEQLDQEIIKFNYA